jgi:hypothetical protein
VNRNAQPINYEVTPDLGAGWITLSGDISGVLAPPETAQVTVEINSNAQTLSEGAHFATIYFTNLTDHIGDTTRQVQLFVGEPVLKYQWTLDSDPGWTTEGQWAFGQPTGGGGQHGGPDPTSGHTGNNVYGYNLNGDYPNYLPETHLTSLLIDCSELFGVHLKFWRWLGVEQPKYDHAYVRVSSDGTNWTTVWENPTEIADFSWVEMDLDISDVADNQSTVYLRWTMGKTDVGYTYCGWNIDDMQVLGYGYAFICGDVNKDGKINVADVVYLINYLFIVGPPPQCEPVTACGDVNKDGKIDVIDVVYLINYLFANGPPPGNF